MRLECKVTIASPDKIQEFTAVYDQTIYQFLVNGHFKVDARSCTLRRTQLVRQMPYKNQRKDQPYVQ